MTAKKLQSKLLKQIIYTNKNLEAKHDLEKLIEKEMKTNGSKNYQAEKYNKRIAKISINKIK